MNVIKRSGMEVLFDKNKIVNAITKAKKDTPTSNITKEAMEEIAEYIEFKCGKLGRAAGIEEIQDMVEQNLMARGEFELAKNYVRYRYKRELIRKKNTTDDKILSLVDCMNEEATQENANKNTHINSTQRDYIAGEVSRDITRRMLLPEDVAKADKEGLIHVHDQDYMIQHMFNCFCGTTKFITNYGIRRFNEFKDGDHVCVKDLYGNLRDAVVHIYGQQKMNIVTLRNGRMTQEIKCTANHRWILYDGSVTTDLRIGDTLWPTQDSTMLNFDCQEKMEAFCLGFVLGDGSDRTSHESVTVRLCGNKINYLNIFLQCGYKIISHECASIGNDIILSCNKYGKFKQDFLNGRAWRFLSPMMQEYIFKGYYAADGAIDSNRLSTSDSRLEEFIEDCSGLAGYYYSSKKEIFHDTNFKQNARLVTYQFVIKSVEPNHKWKVVNIKSYKGNYQQLAYCVEEPITHTFTLEKGIVTGNCCLINLEDMLQNGTVISGTKIDRPHSFSVACNIATQIMAQVASNQYGGQSVSLAHLAPFVDVSRKSLRKDVIKEFNDIGFEATEEIINKVTEERLMKEINKGIQTIQYQILTLSSVNGQAPFVSIFIYLNETKNEREKKDLAIIAEEMLKQRIQGVKNAAGQWVTPAFPKILYVLEPDNISEDQPYWYLTELAAKCTAKRMVPDYISEKKMFENKEGNCFPSMGCVDGAEVITYKLNNILYVESFERAWNRISAFYNYQINFSPVSQFIVTPGLYIYDSSSNGFVEVKKFIRNNDMGRWYRVTFNGRTIMLTADHPLPTQRGRIQVKDMVVGDMVPKVNMQYSEAKYSEFMNPDKAWLLGIMICDGSYVNGSIACYFGLDEYDIVQRVRTVLMKDYGLESKLVERHRGEKGNYFEIRAHSQEMSKYLENLFGGINKIDRHIPNVVFSDFSSQEKTAFLAGMIDADGYIRRTTLNKLGESKENRIHIGSTNKELALQQMLLANSLGLNGNVKPNWYKGKQFPENIRYRVDIGMSNIFNDELSCEKKSNFNKNYIARLVNQFVTVESIEFIGFRNRYEYDVETVSDRFDVSGINSHNCRSFLSVWKDNNGKPKFYGRFNCGVCTINLPDIALSSHKDMNEFWKIFDERLELCHKALLAKYDRLKGIIADYSPIHWMYGAISRLKSGEKIDKYLHGGYSTISLGYAGLYECVKYMTGVSHTDEKIGKPFALKVMQHLNDKCEEWKNIDDLGYSVYGSPIESSTYKFAKCLQKRFGIIEGITDHNYVTNSYHVFVKEPIDIFHKFKLESEFQKLSMGGLENTIPEKPP